jgi:group II intron reverse transcriptase/maturase
MHEPSLQGKSHVISKQLVWDAWLRVKENGGAAGPDGVTVEQFEANVQDRLYVLWNRMSSGSYFPGSVRAVEIPKRGKEGVRVLGVPNVVDRVAQTVIRMVLEPVVDREFHPDSYGYRPGRSPHDALRVCRERCWRRDWVVDLDVKAFFDTVPWDRMLRAVAHHTDQKWILLYVERCLKSPMQKADGALVERTMGTPQGGPLSPLLANLYLHWGLDSWMTREFPGMPFERFADDVVIHCASEQQARDVRDAVARRLTDVGLEIHPDKTRIVYCKDSNRTGEYENTSFTFLSYTFRPRKAWNKNRKVAFTSFQPAASGEKVTEFSRRMHDERLHRRTSQTLNHLAASINPEVRGWLAYFTVFYSTAVIPLCERIDRHLIRWAKRKYKRLRNSNRKAREWLKRVRSRDPDLFAHWKLRY